MPRPNNQFDETTLRTLIKNLNVGIVLTDEQGIIIEWNNTLARETLITRNEVLGTYLWDIQWRFLPPEKRTDVHRSTLQKAIQIACKTGKLSGLENGKEFLAIIPDGSNRHFELHAFVIKTLNGYRLGASLRDVTQRRELSEQIIRKSNALEEIIAQIEIEKQKIREDISNNIQKIIMPILIKMKANTAIRPHVHFLEKSLQDMNSSYGSKITNHNLWKLTAKELEICTMIKTGMSNKEIATIQGTAVCTVEAERRSIRKKLGLTNKKCNLQTFLSTL